MLRFLPLAGLAVTLSCATASTASAQVPLLDSFGGAEGFGGDCLSPNDDGSSVAIPLAPAFPLGLEFFGERHTVMYVNTNGNITFNGSLSQYTPSSFPVANRPMIAPYWGDIDIRGGACDGDAGDDACEDPAENGVWWHLEPGRVVVTWDEVGYFQCNDTKKMSFQLVLTEARYCGVDGDFDVEFRYDRCEWEAGGASGDDDDNGLCTPDEDCTPAQVGFDAGNLTDFVSVMGSMMPGIHTRMCTDSNIGTPGLWRFQIRRGQVSCPDAGQLCDTGDEGICGEGRTQCMGSGTVCEQVLDPTDEGCNGADDDCDGATDEGDLCPDLQLCHRGGCIDPCFEGGCPPGEVCTGSGVCAEAACETVECDPGERCVGGTCVDACDDGVVCPAGQTCRFGRCQDLCDVLECDACSVCNAGACTLHCVVTGCPEGSSCEETGECVEDACLNVRCGPQRRCVDGACADACLGVVCPEGELCRMGGCVSRASLDLPDASIGADGGPIASDDGAVSGMDGGGDAGPGGEDGGCGCRAIGARRSGAIPILLGLALMTLVIRRRSR